MAKRKAAFFFPQNNIVSNTFIGGMGSVWTDAATMASNTSLTEPEILGFMIDGSNNIRCRVEVPYTVNANALNGVSQLTYYVDVDGHMTNPSPRNFYNCANFQKTYCTGITQIGINGGLGNWGLNDLGDYAYFPGVTLSHNFALNSETSVKTIYLPDVVNLRIQSPARTSMSGLTALERCVIPVGIFDDISWNYPYFLNVKLNAVFYVDPSMGVADRFSFARVTLTNTLVGDSCIINGLTYTCVAAGAVEGEFNLGANDFATNANLAASVNSDTRSGTLGKAVMGGSGADYVIRSDTKGAAFDGITFDLTNLNVASPTTGSTGNGFDRHPTIIYVEDDRSATIKYVNDTTLPDPPTGLSASSITATTFDINFTPPTPNVNGTDGYEVWVSDGVSPWQIYIPQQEVTTSGDTVTNLQGGTTYKVKMRTFDGFYNLSSFTSEITVNTL